MSRTNYDVIRKVTANGIFATRAAHIYVLLATSKFQQFAASTDRLSPDRESRRFAAGFRRRTSRVPLVSRSSVSVRIKIPVKLPVSVSLSPSH